MPKPYTLLTPASDNWRSTSPLGALKRLFSPAPDRPVAPSASVARTTPAATMPGARRGLPSEQGVDDRSGRLDSWGGLTIGEGRDALWLLPESETLKRDAWYEPGPGFAPRWNVHGQAFDDRPLAFLLRFQSVVSYYSAQSFAARLERPLSPAQYERLAALALGLSPNRLMAKGDWRAPDNLLIAGNPYGGMGDMLHGVLRVLTGRARGGGAELWLAISTLALERLRRDVPPLDGLPVLWDGAPDGRLLAEVIECLALREHCDALGLPDQREPDLFLVADDLECCPDLGLLRRLCHDGPRRGIHIVALTEDAEAVAVELLREFDTRLVLPQATAARSRRVLGVDDATFVDPESGFLAQLTARAPLPESAPERLQGRATAQETAVGAPPGAPRTPDEAPGRRPDGQGSGDTGDMAPAPRPLSAAATRADPPLATGAAATLAPSSAAPAPVERPRPVTIGSGPVSRSTAAATLLPIRIRCFGGFAVASGDQTLSYQRRYREWQVLGFLAVHPRSGVPKDRLLATFWRGRDREEADHCLGTTLHRLRRLLQSQVPGLPREVVACTRRGICRLHPDLVHSDAQEFLALLERAASAPTDEQRTLLERADRLFAAPLLEHSFWPWLAEPIHRNLTAAEWYATELGKLRHALARWYLADGQLVHAGELLRDLFVRRPAHEEAAADLLRCYAQLGDLDGLEAVYRDHRAALEQLAKAPAGRGREVVLEQRKRRAEAAYREARASFERRNRRLGHEQS